MRAAPGALRCARPRLPPTAHQKRPDTTRRDDSRHEASPAGRHGGSLACHPAPLIRPASHGPSSLLALIRDMTSLEHVLRVLRAQETALRAMGISQAAVFGSIARGDATERSDINLLVDIDPARRLSLFDFIGIKHYLDDTFGHPVDLVSRVVSTRAFCRRSNAI